MTARDRRTATPQRPRQPRPAAARRTRIVATIGPASSSKAVMEQLVAAGLDVARLNFSHGEPEGHRTLARRLRGVAGRAKADVALLGDLSGPKIRLGELSEAGDDGSVLLEAGDEIRLVAGARTNEPRTLPVRHRALLDDLGVGDRVLLADGIVELRVVEVSRTAARAEVVDGGRVRSRAGVNLPDADVTTRNPTARDLRFAELAVEIGCDVLALSFVREAADVLRLRRHLERRGTPLPIIAKIEKPQALDRLEEILDASDGLMVARGDLGVECPPETVPLHQKRMIALANQAAKPVITATQMLESMVRESRPTRAEASDVANAILDGTDALMLSAETATGDHPVAAVRMMDAIALHIEESEVARQAVSARREELADLGDVAEAIARAARHAAEHVSAAAILVHTESGESARRVARQRPVPPVIAFTAEPAVARRLHLVQGLAVLPLPRARTTDRLVKSGLDAARDAGLVRSGDLVVVVAGSNPLIGASNMVKVDRID